MSATIVREKNQTTLPADVLAAAGIRVKDQVDWRFEDGEIRGRKLVPAKKTEVVYAKLVRRGGKLVFAIPAGLEPAQKSFDCLVPK